MTINKGEYYDFFYSILLSLEGKVCLCKNCNRKIAKIDLVNLAHILPKSIFKSISKDVNNIVLLCHDCHGQYDSSWKNATKMKCWESLVDIYKTNLKQKIIEQHKILEYFDKE